MNDELVSVIRDNPQSTILIKHGMNKDWIRIDIRDDFGFSVDTGSGLGDVNINTDESTRKKSREDLKMRLVNAGINRIRKVYAISRVNEDDDES